MISIAVERGSAWVRQFIGKYSAITKLKREPQSPTSYYIFLMDLPLRGTENWGSPFASDEEEITWHPCHGYVIRSWLVASPVTLI